VPLFSKEEYNDFIGDFDKAIAELTSLSGEIEIRFANKFISFLEVTGVNNRSKEIKKYFKNARKRSILKYYLKFSTEITVKDQDDYVQKKIHYNSFEYFTESYIRHLLIYLNLAKPGAFDTREGYIITKQKLRSRTTTKISYFPTLINTLPYAIEVAKKYKWPTLKELPIKRTINWLNENWKAFEIMSDNRIQRALNAFSYLFHDNTHDNSPNDLFHALIGIEAIFVQGNSNIQEQVNQKSQILLGRRNDFKKVFTELYDYRSRYIHGQLNFINKYFVDDMGEAIDQMLNTSEKSAFATAILIASIQKHIELNKTELEYELVLKI